MKLPQYTLLLLMAIATFTACNKHTISPRPKQEVHYTVFQQYHLGATFRQMEYHYDIAPYGKDTSQAGDTVRMLLKTYSDSTLRLTMKLNEVEVNEELVLDSLVIRIDDLYSDGGEVHYIWAHRTNREKDISLYMVAYWDISRLPEFHYSMKGLRTGEYISAASTVDGY